MNVTDVFTSLINNIYQVKKEDNRNELYLYNTTPIELQRNHHFNKNNENLCC